MDCGGFAAGVDTIEHGDGLTDALIDEMVRKGVYWVPTITVERTWRRGGAGIGRDGGFGKSCISEGAEEECEDCARDGCSGFDWKS